MDLERAGPRIYIHSEEQFDVQFQCGQHKNPNVVSGLCCARSTARVIKLNSDDRDHGDKPLMLINKIKYSVVQCVNCDVHLLGLKL